MKPFKPGSPSDENSARPISPQKTGATFRSPPKSSSPRAPLLRSSRKATKQNRRLAVMPWLNIWSTTPLSAAVRSSAVPVALAAAKTPSRQ